jgi:hypothetical protein
MINRKSAKQPRKLLELKTDFLPGFYESAAAQKILRDISNFQTIPQDSA